MKTSILLFHLSLVSLTGYTQTWTTEQLNKANTAKTFTYLSLLEKQTIMYINLARMYPKEFVKIELAGYAEAKGKKAANARSLTSKLNSMKAVPALRFNKDAYENAKCFSKEQGEKGTVGHERIKCPDGKYAECCSYGMNTGKDVVMQWLIDYGVANLGHRDCCLNGSYTLIGVSEHKHKTYGTCCVADFK